MDHGESQEERGIYGKCKRGASVAIGSYGRAIPGFYVIFLTYNLPDGCRAHLSCAPLGSFGPTSPEYIWHYPFYIYNMDVQIETGTE